ncbi:MAG TPA: hypothetical protein VJH91_03225 [Candidatus Paceibacterota bacterium]
MTWIKQHIFIFVGLVALIVAGVWYGLSSDTSAPPLLTTETVVSGTLAEANADQEIVASLLALRAVSLSGTIFLDPAFMSLKDFSTPLINEPWGRENPFAPLGVSVATSSRPSVPAPGR